MGKASRVRFSPRPVHEQPNENVMNYRILFENQTAGFDLHGPKRRYAVADIRITDFPLSDRAGASRLATGEVEMV